jgi:hypothetical protein
MRLPLADRIVRASGVDLPQTATEEHAMVRLSKIYTKTGDNGQTMLGDGSMTPKESLRVEAYGEVDEANATLGIAIARVPSRTRAQTRS